MSRNVRFLVVSRLLGRIYVVWRRFTWCFALYRISSQNWCLLKTHFLLLLLLLMLMLLLLFLLLLLSPLFRRNICWTFNFSFTFFVCPSTVAGPILLVSLAWITSDALNDCSLIRNVQRKKENVSFYFSLVFAFLSRLFCEKFLLMPLFFSFPHFDSISVFAFYNFPRKVSSCFTIKRTPYFLLTVFSFLFVYFQLLLFC